MDLAWPNKYKYSEDREPAGEAVSGFAAALKTNIERNLVAIRYLPYSTYRPPAYTLHPFYLEGIIRIIDNGILENRQNRHILVKAHAQELR